MYDYKKSSIGVNITAKDLIIELSKFSPEATIHICGSNCCFIHVEKDESKINLDFDTCDDGYDDNDIDDIQYMRSIKRNKNK